MKEKISLYLVATVKRIGALWVGFLVSMIPVYILRGNIHDLDTLAYSCSSCIGGMTTRPSWTAKKPFCWC